MSGVDLHIERLRNKTYNEDGQSASSEKRVPHNYEFGRDPYNPYATSYRRYPGQQPNAHQHDQHHQHHQQPEAWSRHRPNAVHSINTARGGGSSLRDHVAASRELALEPNYNAWPPPGGGSSGGGGSGHVAARSTTSAAGGLPFGGATLRVRRVCMCTLE